MKIQKIVVFVKKNLKANIWKIKKYCKVRYHCHYTGEYRSATHSILNLKYSVPKKIPIAFHNGSNYDYHLIIKDLAEELKKQFTCLGENTEKYITFTVPIETEVTRIDKNGEEITKYISSILQFIDSARFMASSLSNLVNNRSERIQRIKCKSRQIIWRKPRNDFLINTNFLTMIKISWFYCCQKVFIVVNIWMSRKNSMKYR